MLSLFAKLWAIIESLISTPFGQKVERCILSNIGSPKAMLDCIVGITPISRDEEVAHGELKRALRVHLAANPEETTDE